MSAASGASSSSLAVKAADVFVKSWISGTRLTPETLPAAPESIDAMYETHLAIQTHPLVASDLGGHAGYKLGAIGAEGQPCIYAPLFGNFVTDKAEQVSASAIQLWQIEPEIALILGEEIAPATDGKPHSVDDVWAAVSEVALSIELCGKRGTPEAYAATTKLGSFADTLSSGGVVLGPRLPAKSMSVASVLCPTKLLVNSELLAEGSGAAAPEGGPAQALTWLANHLNGRGLSLQKGQVVATGQTCNTKAIKAGDIVKATFGELGEFEMAVAP